MIIIYTVLFDPSDKSLNPSVKTTLYRKEKLADKIQFLFPLYYQEYNLSQCKVLLKYKRMEVGIAGVEVMEKDTAVYKKEFLRCVLPIDTKINDSCGTVNYSFSFITVDSDNKIVYVLHTGEDSLVIEADNDYFEYANTEDESMSKLEEIVASKITKYEEEILVAESDGCEVIEFTGQNVEPDPPEPPKPPIFPHPPLRTIINGVPTIWKG